MRRLIIVCCMVVISVSCSRQTTVDVGMIVSLTGNYSPLLITARNGAVLAAEEINQKGGRIKLNLIVEDDESNHDTVEEKAVKLLDSGTQFFLLSITSAAYASIERLLTQSPVLSLSTTITSDEFRGKDDNFIRMTADISMYSIKLADYAVARGKKKIAVVYDSNNLTYAETLYDHFIDRMNSSADSNEFYLIEYNTLDEPSFRALGERIASSSPDAALIIASPFDAALICQNIRSGDPLLLLAPWAVSDELIKNGGNSVENAVFFLRDTSGAESERHKTFVSAYKRRFGAEPSFQSVMNYDSVYFLYEIISSQDEITPATVKKGIIDAASYDGVDQTYIIDEYGDCSNKLVTSTIKNGKIVNM